MSQSVNQSLYRDFASLQRSVTMGPYCDVIINCVISCSGLEAINCCAIASVRSENSRKVRSSGFFFFIYIVFHLISSDGRAIAMEGGKMAQNMTDGTLEAATSLHDTDVFRSMNSLVQPLLTGMFLLCF